MKNKTTYNISQIHIEEIDPKEILQLFNKNLKLIFIIILILMTSTSLITYLVLNKEYKSNLTIMISNTREYNQQNLDITYDDILLNQKLVNTYEKIIKSKVITNQVINNLSLDINSEDLEKNIYVNALDDTEIINIEVKWGDPVIAAKIANEIALCFMDYIKYLMNIDNIKIIDIAEANPKAVQPKPLLYIGVSILIGVVLSFFVVLGREYLSTTIKTEKEAKEIVKDYAILGVLPFIKKCNIKKTLIMQSDPKSIVGESFRTLRTNVQYIKKKDNIKVIQITSSVQYEGKSTVAANFAVALAQSGKRVLLMDCDLRRPTVHDTLNLNNFKGLVNVIINETTLQHSINTTMVNNLYALVSGPIPPNPSELLDGKRIKEIIEISKNVFDYIIIDAPPVVPVSDALILSKIVDGTILTLALGTEKEHYNKMIKSLEQVDSNILGTVINKVVVTAKDYSRYTYKYE